MAIDVYLQPKVEVPRIGGDCELIAQFEDDGCYHFLLPLFEKLKQKTGQQIDLYGDASFGASDLEELKATIAAAKQLLNSQPKTWEVLIGTQTFPLHQKIYSTVRKNELKRMLDEIEAAINKAKATDSFITFWGD